MEIINEHEEIVINKKMENHMMFIWQLANMIQWNKLVEIRLMIQKNKNYFIKINDFIILLILTFLFFPKYS